MGNRVLIVYNTLSPRWGYKGEEGSDLIGLTSYPELFRPIGTFFYYYFLFC